VKTMTDHIGEANAMIPMTQQRLDEIRTRCARAKRGPWAGAAPRGDYRFSVLDANDLLVCRVNSISNTDFIAHARQDIPALLSEVERLQAEVERFRAKRNETIDAIENLMESCRACDMCALNESDDTCSDNGEGYCSPVWIGRKEG
jgi:hypothetical protein